MANSKLVPIACVAATLASWGCRQDLSPPVAPTFNVTNGSQVVEICKIGPAGSTADFTVSASGGTLLLGSSFTLPALPDACQNGVNAMQLWFANAAEDPDASITVAEVGASSGVVLEQIRAFSNLDGLQVIFPPPSDVTVHANYTNGAIIYFKNIGGQGEGCTPGYWKQDQHFGNWTAPYTPGTLFGSVFANAFPGKTLLEVAWLGGGGLNALGRHAVAALLNAASPDVDYGMTVAEVIAAFNAAYTSGSYEATKNRFATLNEQGCPLALAR